MYEVRGHTFLALLMMFASSVVIAGEEVSFPGGKASGYHHEETVTGTFKLPNAASSPVPAVVVLHGSAGIDGRGAYYIEELNKNGIATLEVFMFSGGNRPQAGTKATFTHAFGALRYLAGRLDIDPQSIGVMGFSFGGIVAIKTASKSLSEAFMSDARDLRFAAHAPFYPLCWALLRAVNDSRNPDHPFFTALTGAPILMFAGGKDDYESSADDCETFLTALPAVNQSSVALQFYPNGTHGWDARGRGGNFVDRFAHGGRGGAVNIEPNEELAADSRTKVVEFFVRVLKANR